MCLNEKFIVSPNSKECLPPSPQKPAPAPSRANNSVFAGHSLPRRLLHSRSRFHNGNPGAQGLANDSYRESLFYTIGFTTTQFKFFQAKMLRIFNISCLLFNNFWLLLSMVGKHLNLDWKCISFFAF